MFNKQFTTFYQILAQFMLLNNNKKINKAQP